MAAAVTRRMERGHIQGLRNLERRARCDSIVFSITLETKPPSQADSRVIPSCLRSSDVGLTENVRGTWCLANLIQVLEAPSKLLSFRVMSLGDSSRNISRCILRYTACPSGPLPFRGFRVAIRWASLRVAEVGLNRVGVRLVRSRRNFPLHLHSPLQQQQTATIDEANELLLE